MEDANAAAVLYRYMLARAYFRKDSHPETFAGPVRRGLEYEISRGVRLFGKIRIDPNASPVITSDAENPDFLAAITGRDDAIEIAPDDLDKLRRYVLAGEPTLPVRGSEC